MAQTMTRPNTRKAALWYAAQGWQIFPVAAGSKRPLTPNGYKDASCDTETIAAWWLRWPDANIGLACGPSGLIGLDFDPAKDLEGAGMELADRLYREAKTATQGTPTNGMHFIYRLPEGARLSNSPGDLPPGFDVRVNGYLLLTPSVVTYDADEATAKGVEPGHTGQYEWDKGHAPTVVEVAELPGFVRELLRPEPPRVAPVFHVNGTREQARPRDAESRMLDELDKLARTAQGGRNDQLNRSAFVLGQLVAGGALHESDVRQKLEDVASVIGLEPRETQRTIESGMGAGMASPRSVMTTPVLIFRNGDKPSMNGNGYAPHDDEAVEDAPHDAGIPLNAFDYRPEDGGILDAWMDTLADDWVFITGYEAWYQWTGTHWQRDDKLVMQYQLQALMDAMNQQSKAARAAALQAGDKDAEKTAGAYVAATKRTKGRIASVEGMAQSQRAQTPAMLDQGNCLSLANGSFDLDTMQFYDHSRADMASYCLPYEFDHAAGCARWRQFVSEVLVKDDNRTPDPDLGLLFQELAGYSLTRDTRHEVMIWLSGDGSNGKTVAITTLARLLGPMAVSVDFQTLGMAGNYDLADLPGARVIFSTESERGGSMAEGYIKRIVSGEMIRARPIYGKPFAFQSTAKIWWAMNDTPNVRDTSNAIWRRLKLLPFRRTFREGEKDTGLLDKLALELPGILNWALEGLVRLRKQGGFTQAASVGAAIETLRYESNPVAQWLAERTQPGGETQATSCYQSYTLWATRNHGPELSGVQFARELGRLGVSKAHKRTGKFYSITINDHVV